MLYKILGVSFFKNVYFEVLSSWTRYPKTVSQTHRPSSCEHPWSRTVPMSGGGESPKISLEEYSRVS